MARLPKSIIKKYGISKKAWSVFRGRRRSRAASPSGKKKMARRKTYPRSRRYLRRFRRPKTIPIIPIVGAGIGVFANTADGSGAPFTWFSNGDWISGMKALAKNYIGYDANNGTWDIWRAKQGLLPLVGGVLIHKALNMLGVNRYFANLPSPLNKVRL